jgi:stage V sporulation protein D (sporulation-specific penicillin-binding protein)
MAVNGKKNELTPRAGRTIYVRIIIMAVIFGFLLFIPVASQLFDIQITNHDYYEQKAVEQQTRDTELSAARGVITTEYDGNRD